MPVRLLLIAFVAALAAGCAPQQKVETPQGAVYLRGCDDGGDGGVIIDGVCL